MESKRQSQPQPPSAAEDEALKKNTDCVYFLASPLTCKKGSECEYRHSDIARVNPRDCWFWLNSSCFNPKCGFRHPPLDGLMGTQMPTPTGPSPPALQTVATAFTHLPSTPNKQAVPCVFFQKGYCMKGDWCPFLHGPNSMSSKAPLVPEAVPATESTFKKAFGGVDKLTQKKVPPTTDVAKSVKVTPQVKSSLEVEHTFPRIEFSVKKSTPQTSVVHELSQYRNVASVGNGNPRVQQPRLLDESGSMNNKDAEEVSREPSPGFDVLVDDEQRDPGYYPGEGQYGMSREHESWNEYGISRSSDYSRIADIANERYQDHPLSYGSHERFKDQYPWDHGASSERMSGGSSSLERRPNARMESRGQVDELDLRHRLAKNKKANGLRSVISHEHARDRDAEDQSYRGFSRDEQHLSRHENSLGSRLRGRIRLPGRSPSPADRDRDMVRTGDRRRLSPDRRTLSSTQGRFRDRIKGSVEEDFSDGGGKNRRGLHSRRDLIMSDNSADFVGPKSLSELKNKKTGECSGHNVTDQQSLGKRKHLMLGGHNRSGSSNGTSFDGPKPLQEILKRKRGETIGSASGGNSSNNEDIVEDNNPNDVDKSTSAEKTGVEESKVQAVDGILVEDGEDQEYEAFERREDGEYDYEQGGGEEFELYDGDENGEIEGEEYPDEEDDDDDDFAKKMGVVYSV